MGKGEINFRKFTHIDGDMDYAKFERTINGTIKKGTYKLLDRFARKQSFHTHCGCAHDCCGHMCGQRVELEYINTGVKITVTTHFNY